MAAQIRASLATILPLIETQIVTVLEWTNPNRVKSVARDVGQIAHYQGDQDILIRPGDFLSLQSYDDGAGRWDTRIRRILEVGVRSRRRGDPTDQDDIWLTDPKAGVAYVALEEAVLNALHQFEPEDSNQNVLTCEPMRIYTGRKPVKAPKDMAAWGYGVLLFEITYQPPLDLTLNFP